LRAQCSQRLQSPRMDLCHVPATQEKGWYLALMAPNVKGPNYAWLDPSRLYCHPQGLQDCVADLLQPFQGDAIDMVAGIDAMGFILGEQDTGHRWVQGLCPLSLGVLTVLCPPPGAAAAATLRKGFLAIRKAGHLCVQTVAQPYTDYSGREKVMEARTDAISPGEPVGCSPFGGLPVWARGTHPQPLPPPGLRILLVDQWVETGGTMRAAIELVERLGGPPLCVPTGVAAICMENSEGGKWIQERYKCSHCVPPRLQPRFDQHQ
ncbi:APT1 phosphoribosyltransferase, partial [Promerops cafer]|nr:APT1 phosphoribosyltransferase [Promerops cafer]